MNAMVELIEFLSDNKLELLCADIRCNGTSLLSSNSSDEEYALFLNSLDYTYSDGYGCQNLFGTLWFKDGTWAERGEYDGSEWWEHRKKPEIPDNLK